MIFKSKIESDKKDKGNEWEKDENLDKSIFFYGFTYHLFDTMSRDMRRGKKRVMKSGNKKLR